jgi:beta-glucosidase
MKKTIIIGSLIAVFLQISGNSVAQNIPQLGKNNVKDVLAAMTNEEKIALVLKYNLPKGDPATVYGIAGYTLRLDRLGITPTVLADGPAGLRIEAKPPRATQTFYCTAFPTATALSSMWNASLVEEVGKAMGNEVLEYNCDVLLAPGMNIQRNPLCGRNFEYYSEDPILSGKTSVAMVRGVQSNGVGTSVKHFAANNNETNRSTINSVVSQRALREIYLRGFEIAIKESQPWTIMTAYNRLNGFYTPENRDLLLTVLRKEWGFKGLVMSDWGGGRDAIAQMKAGNNLMIPWKDQSKDLIVAINNKTLDIKTLDENVLQILEYIQKTPRFKKYQPSLKPDLTAHAAVAHQAATEAMVLLKNDNQTLPLKKGQTIALFGKTSYDFIAGGTGSGEVHYEHAISVKQGLTANGFKVDEKLESIYKNFIDSLVEKSVPDKWNQKKYAVVNHTEMQVATEIIEKESHNSDVAIITIGRISGEGSDRKEDGYFTLSKTEKDLIVNASNIYHAAKKKVIVVLNIGGVIETASWRNYPDAILNAWQTGQTGGAALADIINGKVNPSGKLPVSYPIAYADVPSAKYFPGEPKNNPINAIYGEGIYVGYRYYNTFNVPTAYEFGYGLSYTNFEFSDLKLNSTVFNDSITATVRVKNTGRMAGKEVAQLYLSAPNTEIDKPTEELKAYAKTKLLKPGESQDLTFTLDKRSLCSFYSGISAWVADKGEYEVRVGNSSKNILQKVTFKLPQRLEVEKLNDVLYPNFVVDDLVKKN